jgi:hypothetical protein
VRLTWLLSLREPTKLFPRKDIIGNYKFLERFYHFWAATDHLFINQFILLQIQPTFWKSLNTFFIIISQKFNGHFELKCVINLCYLTLQSMSLFQRVEQINELKSNWYGENFWADLTFVRSCDEINKLLII